MVRNLLLLTFFCLVSTVMVAQTSLTGKVTDEDTNEPILFGTVSLYKEGSLVTGTDTDLDGVYNFPNIDPGTYEVEVSYVGYAAVRQTGVQVFGGQTNKADFKLGTGGGVDLDEVVVREYKVPLVKADQTSTGGTLTSEQLKKLPTRNIGAIAANVAGVSSGDEGDALNIKGSRSASTFFYVDGIRVLGGLIPESEIEQIQVVTGGIEAQYGDVTGGLINITTKGPSKRFSGSFDAETSEFLDPYRNSLIGASLSGPIIAKRDENGNVERSILGFRVSGRYTYRFDDDPPAIPVFRVTDEKLAELEANPVISLGENGRVVSAEELVGPDDVQVLDAKPFENREIINFTGKLDARLSDAVDVSLTGSYAQNVNRFTPGGASEDWRVFNSHNNPFATDTDFRGNFRFRHRLGKQSSGASDEERASSSPIQNFSYIVQLGFERNNQNLEDVRHEDRLFDYGYIGDFNTEWRPSFAFENMFDGTVVGTHTDFTPTFLGYTPGQVNPILAAYNNSSDLSDELDFVATNGQVSDQFDRSFEHHRNVGWVYDVFRDRQEDTRTLNLTGNFDFKPGGSSKAGVHNVQFGLMYEERIERSFDANPFELWQVAQQQANRHILGVDTSSIVGQVIVPTGGFDSVSIDIFAPLLDLDAFSGNRFFRQVRELTGQGLDEFVNVDGLTPDQLSLGLFSAQELTDRDLIGYYGFDYTGNHFNGTFEDFFTARNEDGIRTFPVAPNRPIYTSAYLQDKFTFKDIIFRLGVRVDRFDANTKVLKDPYSLYEIISASDFHSNPDFGQLDTRPGNIGDDFRVYVSSDDGTEVEAYRDGDQWYRANGTPVNNGNLIFDSGSLVFPKIRDVNARGNAGFIKDDDFNIDASLKDYEAQINVMPRLAFSFPISDDANFFAHYDVLVQRPASNNIVTGADYFYFVENFEGVKNNANLLPEKTIDYEVGFQQKLTNSSAIKIAAYYKEIRDLIQRRTYLFAAPSAVSQYTTFDNQDFGTVKGFTFQYDLRRTGNVSGLIGYTLQFADGTGSDVNSQAGLTTRGNLRTLFPLSFDERHRVNASIDYRYRSGKKYNGPTIAGVDIFANTGINLQGVLVSGRPFTATEVPAQFGGDGTVGAINGARLPWNSTLNLRVDKDFKVGGPNGITVNGYLRVSNLFNALNLRNLYTATADPQNDGFLQSSRGQSVINSLEASNRNLDNFFASYQWRLLNPDFYSQPRRIFVGLSFGF